MKTEILKFGVVGVAAVSVDFFTYSALTEVLSLYTPIAKGTGFIAGALVAYGANRVWTFAAGQGAPWRPFSFGILYLFSLALNVSINSAMLAWLPESPLTEELAFCIATGASATANFLGMKFHVFREQPRKGTL